MDTTRTTYLGQFSQERAETITQRLESKGIVSWRKEAGPLTRFLFIGDWGVRLFVDRDRVSEAAAIVEDTTGPFGAVPDQG
ncbi:MAG: hypothetical protein WD080_11545 [Egibacteraceae bacterium]